MNPISDSVALVKYTGNLYETFQEALTLVGGLESRSPFVIKPNISTTDDKTGYANTRLDMVETLIRLALNKNRKLAIRIVESDSEAKYVDEAFEKFGYRDLEERMRNSSVDLSLINLSKLPTTPIELDGLFFKNPELPNLLVGHKYVVSLAVAKTHSLTFVTGTMKNLFGLLPRKNKSTYHKTITEVIVDLNRLVKPNLCIIDARVGLEGWNGPKKRLVNALILGRQPVSVDATMARIMSFDPEKIRHIVEGEKYGLGTIHQNVLGENPESVAVKFNPPL